jgi:TrmH family RNA methyltransferase
MEITSLQNERIKHLLLLQQKSAVRRQEGLFVVEGQRELLHCINAGYEVQTIFADCEKCGDDLKDIPTDGIEIVEVSSRVYEKIAYRGSTEGMVAVVKTRQHTLKDLENRMGENPLYIVLESVEKPGNMGAILRSADAAGVDGVIICDPLTDLYNPNLIRASIGAIFTVPTVACTSEECIAWLKEKGIQILTAQLQDSSLYYDTDMKRPTAIVMGTEATGLTTQWREAADRHIRIPMCGKLDSLNVSVSSAILMFEAVRQRQEKKK